MSAPESLVRPATMADLRSIDDIYNEAILTSTATWDEEPWSPEQRRRWFHDRTSDNPALVAEVEGRCAGFAYMSYYRPRSGYRFTREDTIYLHQDFRGQGVGSLLLGALIDEARRLGIHCLIAVIAGDNQPSIRLHRKLGFEVAGIKRECGFKFGAWQDLTEMTLLL